MYSPLHPSRHCCCSCIAARPCSTVRAAMTCFLCATLGMVTARLADTVPTDTAVHAATRWRTPAPSSSLSSRSPANSMKKSRCTSPDTLPLVLDPEACEPPGLAPSSSTYHAVERREVRGVTCRCSKAHTAVRSNKSEQCLATTVNKLSTTYISTSAHITLMLPPT